MSGKLRVWLPLVLLVVLGACGGGLSNQATLDMGEEELFAAGKAAVENGDHTRGREYLRRYEVRYPRGEHIAEAKFLIAESFYQRRMNEEKVEGVALFRSFLTFYPRHPLGCDAQYRIAEYYHSRMRSPERDQTETRQAVEEARKLLGSYPDCERLDEARRILRESLDRLAESDYRVGKYYTKIGRHDAATHRFRDVIGNYPEYTRLDMVYWELYRSLRKVGLQQEAAEVADQLRENFPGSSYVGKLD